MTLSEIVALKPNALAPLSYIGASCGDENGYIEHYIHADDRILDECGELSVAYTCPDTFERAVEMWASSNMPRWRKIFDTTILKYNPIINYERFEELSDVAVSSGSGNSSANSGSSGNTTDKTAGFNSDALAVKGGSEHSASADSSSNYSSSGNSTNTRTGKVYGNVGVTTTQQMIEEERAVVMFDFGSIIVSEFKKRFCILVY